MAVIDVGGVMIQLVDEGDAIVRAIKQGKRWEAETRAMWPSLIDPLTTVIDVGAYSGVYAISAALVGAGVIAFEPHPANYDRLLENQRLNNVVIGTVPYAMSNRKGTFLLRMPTALDVMNDQASLEGDGGITVDVRTNRLDAEWSFPSRVGLIKIDVERHEPAVIEGAIGLLDKDRPALLVEELDKAMHEAVRVVLPNGYRQVAVLDGRNVLYRSE